MQNTGAGADLVLVIEVLDGDASRPGSAGHPGQAPTTVQHDRRPTGRPGTRPRFHPRVRGPSLPAGSHGAPHGRLPVSQNRPGWQRLSRPRCPPAKKGAIQPGRSEGHTAELQSLMRISYAAFCVEKKNDI